MRRATALVAVLFVASCSGRDGVAVTTTVPTTAPPTTVATTEAPTTQAPTTQAPTTTTALAELAPPLRWADAAPFTGVVQLTVNGRPCTGTVVETGVDEAPAYVLTAGHCTEAQTSDPTGVLVDRPARGSARFPRIPGGPRMLFGLPVAGVPWATMRGTDLAVVELRATLGEVRAAGFRPMPVAPTPPEPGSAVTFVGVPYDGLARIDQVRRAAPCLVGAERVVLEAPWWFAALANDCPGLRRGASGAPLVADGALVAVVNTVAATTAEEACRRDHPCEAVGGVVEVVPGRGYAVATAGLAACFPGGRFTLGAQGCPAAPPQPWSMSSYPAEPVAPGAGAWAVEVRGNGTVRLRQGPAGASCEGTDGYGEPQAVGERLSVERPLPPAGAWVTCVAPDGGVPLAAYLVVGG
jgi:hypothetical protein